MGMGTGIGARPDDGYGDWAWDGGDCVPASRHPPLRGRNGEGEGIVSWTAGPGDIRPRMNDREGEGFPAPDPVTDVADTDPDAAAAARGLGGAACTSPADPRACEGVEGTEEGRRSTQTDERAECTPVPLPVPPPPPKDTATWRMGVRGAGVVEVGGGRGEDACQLCARPCIEAGVEAAPLHAESRWMWSCGTEGAPCTPWPGDQRTSDGAVVE